MRKELHGDGDDGIGNGGDDGGDSIGYSGGDGDDGIGDGGKDCNDCNQIQLELTM